MSGLRLILFIFVISMNSFAQQVSLVGIDVHTVTIERETVQDFIQQMNEDSQKYKIKEEVELKKGKFGKPKIKSRCLFHPDGTIKYKVDYSWGKDSSRVFYTYDTIGRLITAINYNSIFGKDDKGCLITLKYDSKNQVISCVSEYQAVNFFYNANGTKESVEIIKFTHLCYPSIKRPKRHFYDTTSTVYFYKYDESNNVIGILNSKNDTLISYKYDGNGNLIMRNLNNFFITNYEYSDGNMIKESSYEIEYPSDNLIVNEICDFTYIDHKMDKCFCKTDADNMENYSNQNIYNEKGQLIEKIIMDEKEKILSRKIYRYEYY